MNGLSRLNDWREVILAIIALASIWLGQYERGQAESARAEVGLSQEQCGQAVVQLTQIAAACYERCPGP